MANLAIYCPEYNKYNRVIRSLDIDAEMLNVQKNAPYITYGDSEYLVTILGDKTKQKFCAVTPVNDIYKNGKAFEIVNDYHKEDGLKPFISIKEANQPKKNYLLK